MRVYLGGAINGCTDDEASGWRESVKEVLSANGHEWRDPMDRDYRGREMEPGIAEAIVLGDKLDITECDVALMNCVKPSWGTAMEIMFANMAGVPVPVVAVLPEGVIPSPWLVYHADVRFGSIVEVAKTLEAPVF